MSSNLGRFSSFGASLLIELRRLPSLKNCWNIIIVACHKHWDSETMSAAVDKWRAELSSNTL